MKADQTLDCLGLYCPMPMALTAVRIKRLKPGEVLEVIVDDQGIKADMPAWCQAMGYDFLGVEEKGGEIRVYVRKTHDEDITP